MFPNRWIGRDGQTLWPPRSPDITPLDLFIGVCEGQSVFDNSFTLNARISDALAAVTAEMLEKTEREKSSID
jgi:hypothetical protein